MKNTPGLCDIPDVSCAVDLRHIARAGPWGTDGHEVGPRAPNGVLGHVGEGLAHGSAEQEGADYFVQGGHILVELRVGVDLLRVDQVGLTRAYLC